MAQSTGSGPLTITNLPLTVGGVVIEDLGEIGSVPQLVKLGSLVGEVGTGIKLAIANPAGVTLIVHSVMVNVTTHSTGACATDVGIAADAVTNADNIIDGTTVAGSAYVRNSLAVVANNGRGSATWGTTQFLNLSLSADSSGLVADVYAVISGLPA